MSDEISGARLDDTLDDLDKMAKGEVRAISDIRAVGEDGAWTVRSFRAENARLREKFAATYARIEHCILVVTRLLEERQPHVALRGDDAPEGQT